jgi:hypothetical protein
LAVNLSPFHHQRTKGFAVPGGCWKIENNLSSPVISCLLVTEAEKGYIRMAGIPAVKIIPDLRNFLRETEKELFLLFMLN